MKPTRTTRPALGLCASLTILAATLCAAPLWLARGQDSKATDAKTSEVKSAAESKSDTAKPEKKQKAKKAAKFSGAELYAMHCNRCHPERYATERTPAQWKTILLHMRVRANLPAKQAKALLKYLQEESGTP